MLTSQTMTLINHDRAVIGLFALILHKRMFIIDDMEFVGKKQSLTNAFLTLDQIKFAATLMNRIGYEIFEEEGKEHDQENIIFHWFVNFATRF